MTIQSEHKKVTLQPDFPVPTEYFQYFYKPSLLERKKVPLGFIFNDTSKVLTQVDSPFLESSKRVGSRANLDPSESLGNQAVHLLLQT